MGVTDWLLESDPAVRWQVLRDLLRTPAEAVAAERARVAAEGWGARLLARQGADGPWAGGARFPAEGRGRDGGGRRVLPGWRLASRRGRGTPLDLDAADARAAVRLRRRSPRRSRAPRDRAGQGPLPVGARGAAVLRRRGRAGHQRQDRRTGQLLRSGRRGDRRSARRRTARGRRVELRGGKRIHSLVVRHDDQRAGGTAGARARRPRDPALDRRPAPRLGLPPRTTAVPPQAHRRGRQPGLAPVLVSDALALRRAARAR